jgi:DNA-binding response OmpR family regulator
MPVRCSTSCTIPDFSRRECERGDERNGVTNRILVVDDEPEITEILQNYLKKEAFDAAAAGTVASALTEIDQRPPDLVLLDIGLPDGSGLEVLRRLNEGRRIPTIVLTTRSEEVDRIVGLEVGADDYIAKPFSPREVIARIRALFRRLDSILANARPAGAVYRVRDLEINEASHEVRVRGGAPDALNAKGEQQLYPCEP